MEIRYGNSAGQAEHIYGVVVERRAFRSCPNNIWIWYQSCLNKICSLRCLDPACARCQRGDEQLRELFRSVQIFQPKTPTIFCHHNSFAVLAHILLLVGYHTVAAIIIIIIIGTVVAVIMSFPGEDILGSLQTLSERVEEGQDTANRTADAAAERADEADRRIHTNRTPRIKALPEERDSPLLAMTASVVLDVVWEYLDPRDLSAVDDTCRSLRDATASRWKALRDDLVGSALPPTLAENILRDDRKCVQISFLAADKARAMETSTSGCFDSSTNKLFTHESHTFVRISSSRGSWEGFASDARWSLCGKMSFRLPPSFSVRDLYPTALMPDNASGGWVRDGGWFHYDGVGWVYYHPIFRFSAVSVRVDQNNSTINVRPIVSFPIDNLVGHRVDSAAMLTEVKGGQISLTANVLRRVFPLVVILSGVP